MLQSVKIDKVENGFLVVNTELEAGQNGGIQPIQKAYIFVVFADVVSFLNEKHGGDKGNVKQLHLAGVKEKGNE